MENQQVETTFKWKRLQGEGVVLTTEWNGKSYNPISQEDVQEVFNQSGMYLCRNHTHKTKSHNKLIERLRKKLEKKN